MGLFYLRGDTGSVLFTSIKLGVTNESGRWEKFFPKTRRRARYVAPVAAPQNPFDNGGYHDTLKAAEYARWLAQRDGIDIPEHATYVVSFAPVAMYGFKRPVKQAHTHRTPETKEIVMQTITIPHFGYDPTAPSKESVVRARPMRAVFSAEECYAECSDEECPYTHSRSWHVWEKDIYIEGPFENKQEAEQYIENNQ